MLRSPNKRRGWSETESESRHQEGQEGGSTRPILGIGVDGGAKSRRAASAIFQAAAIALAFAFLSRDGSELSRYYGQIASLSKNTTNSTRLAKEPSSIPEISASTSHGSEESRWSPSERSPNLASSLGHNNGSDDSSLPSSPACNPHFRLALPDGEWTTAKKFERLYFYHVRKAGGTNLRQYFRKVAQHHGLKYQVMEYGVAEAPGTHDEPTFYVTHMREPVSRSISHFKYEGRWDCRQLVNNRSYVVPTNQNANQIEDWNQEFGFHPSGCAKWNKETGRPIFRMALCAVNCYSQWFSGLSCPWWDPPEVPGPGARPIRREVPMIKQRNAAREKIMRYNFVVITEMLSVPEYAAAVDRFFGVSGVAHRGRGAWCEPESHQANNNVPLVIRNETLNNLTRLNEIDIGLYREMSDCLGEGSYDFATWDQSRFESNGTFQEVKS